MIVNDENLRKEFISKIESSIKYTEICRQQKESKWGKDTIAFAFYKDKKVYAIVKDFEFDKHAKRKNEGTRWGEYPISLSEPYSSLYEIKNVFEISSDYEKEANKNKHYYTSYHYLSDTSNRLNLIDNPCDNFKKDFPYAPYDIILGSGNFSNIKAVNLMGMYPTNPQIELIAKNNSLVRFAQEWMDCRGTGDLYRRAFGPGKNFQEITGLPNWLWKKMAEKDVNIREWDTLRKWHKQLLKESQKAADEAKKAGKKVGVNDVQGFDQDTIETLFNMGFYGNSELKNIRDIVNKAVDEDGKRLLSIKTLVSFLERIDMYQAIYPREGIELLSDYLRMCSQMKVTPRMDSDSLKREHDVMARNHNTWAKLQKYSPEQKAKFTNRSNELKKYSEFKNDKLMVVVPEKIEDLINEGNNNHNCVACYTDRFMNGESNIYFIRHVDKPEKSYITVELNESNTDYKQAYLGSNHRIYDQEDWKFINGWLENNKAINAR